MRKIIDIAINDFRSGAWGRITLESPEDFSQWSVLSHAREAERRAAKRERRGAK